MTKSACFHIKSNESIPVAYFSSGIFPRGGIFSSIPVVNSLLDIFPPTLSTSLQDSVRFLASLIPTSRYHHLRELTGPLSAISGL